MFTWTWTCTITLEIPGTTMLHNRDSTREGNPKQNQLK